MRHPRWSSMVLLLSLAGCASVPARVERRPEIVIDIARLRAVGPDWQSELVDCSDTTFLCFEAPGHFLMAFARSCPRELGPWTRDWTFAGYPFRFTAPYPHFGLPSGGYVSDKYPYAHLAFRAELGFTSLWIRANPVMSDNWGGHSVAEYDFKYAGGASPFRCR